MSAIEVGVEGRRILLLITVPDADHPGEAYLTRVPLSADEAREVVNGLGEAIRFVAGS
jgi:hypothetical protein